MCKYIVLAVTRPTRRCLGYSLPELSKIITNKKKMPVCKAVYCKATVYPFRLFFGFSYVHYNVLVMSPFYPRVLVLVPVPVSVPVPVPNPVLVLVHTTTMEALRYPKTKNLKSVNSIVWHQTYQKNRRNNIMSIFNYNYKIFMYFQKLLWIQKNFVKKVCKRLSIFSPIYECIISFNHHKNNRQNILFFFFVNFIFIQLTLNFELKAKQSKCLFCWLLPPRFKINP